MEEATQAAESAAAMAATMREGVQKSGSSSIKEAELQSDLKRKNDEIFKLKEDIRKGYKLTEVHSTASTSLFPSFSLLSPPLSPYFPLFTPIFPPSSPPCSPLFFCIFFELFPVFPINSFLLLGNLED